MEYKYHMGYKISLILIILFAFFLRAIGIFNDLGLNYDELFSFDMALAPLDIFFQKLISTDYHPPLFYLILKGWIALFGTNDTIIYLLSICFSVFCIPVAYLIGKQLKSRDFGILLAIFFAFSSLFIYKAQEARFYQLACLEVLLTLYFSLKYINKFKIKHLVYLLLSELFLLYTLTLGVIFVAVNSVLLFLYLFLKHKNYLKSFLYAHFLFIILYLPQFFITICQIINSRNTLLQNPWDWIYNQDSISSLFKFLTTTFLPFDEMLKFQEISAILYILFLIFAFFIVKKENNKNLNYLYVFNLTYLLILLILTYFEILTYSSSLNYFYSNLILQILLLFSVFKHNKIILIALLTIQIYATSQYIQMPSFLLKKEIARFGLPTKYINSFSNHKLIYAPYGDKLIFKYVQNFTPFKINGDEIFTMPYSKDIGKMIFDDEITNLPLSERIEYLKKYSISKTPSCALLSTYNNAINKLKPNDYFITLINFGRIIDEKLIAFVLDNENEYFPVSSLTVAKITNDINNLAYYDKRLTLLSNDIIDDEWVIQIYRKN